MRKLLLSVVVAYAAGCGEIFSPDEPSPPAATLSSFASAEELDAFLKTNGAAGSGFADAGSVGAGGTGGTGGSTGNQTITNNQVQGVDEGDIVKNIDDWLLVLRKGRLYATSIAVGGHPTQTDSVRVAEDETLNQAVWYDEMLVKGRNIYVIGYRYLGGLAQGLPPSVWGATELQHFTLGADGHLNREQSRYLQSYDYYSSKNYMSRLVGDTLVLYSPLSATSTSLLPQRLTYRGNGKFALAGNLFEAHDVVRAPRASPVSLFHAIIRCTLELQCTTRPLLASYAHGRFVTGLNAFLHVDSQIFRISLRTGDVSVHALTGSTLDQFSFHQEGQSLRVVTRNAAAHSAIEHRVIPLAAFDNLGQQPLEPLTRPLSAGQGHWLTHQRFTEGHLIAALSGGSARVLQVSSLDGLSNHTVPFEGYITRIEPLAGVGALISSQTGAGLRLQVLQLPAVTLGPAIELSAAGEGEHRSHAFFFRPGSAGGTFGITVSASRSGWWGNGVSNLAFFNVDTSGVLGALNTISSSVAAGGACETSCVDWYGNTRPIFMNGRAFALMGSELQELDDTTLLARGPRSLLAR